eukprot:jgi/Picre1/27311/NNA_000280.t1
MSDLDAGNKHWNYYLCTINSERCALIADNDTIIYNTALSALAKNGQMTTAEDVYADIKCPDQVTYETMIAGYGIAGNAQKAEYFFSLLEQEGMSPQIMRISTTSRLEANSHLYNALIACCDRFHKYEKAIAFLQEMKDKNIKGNSMTQSLKVTICTAGVRSVESQQAAITAISAAVAAAGSIMIRAGVF